MFKEKVEQILSRLKPKKPPMLGVDISSAAVKLLELSFDGEHYRVESYAIEALPPNAVQEHRINDLEAVGDSVRRAVKRSRTKAKYAAVAVPAASVITKVVPVPSAPNEDEMESQVELEAEKYIPFSLDEVNLDFVELGPSENEPDYTDVLLVASRSENVELRVAALELAGLEVKVVDVESYAQETACTLLTNQLPGGGVDRTIAILDIGATYTTVNVLHDLKLIYTREQDFGGRQLTEEIMRRYGLTYEEAGMAKKNGGLPDNYEPELLSPFKQSLAQQLERTLQFFFASGQHTQVDHVLLSGGTASIPGLAQLIARKLGIPTSVANPFADVALAPKVKAQALANDGPAMLLACGLALRGFD
jgi:type IV pilus assembly protein PilM